MTFFLSLSSSGWSQNQDFSLHVHLEEYYKKKRIRKQQVWQRCRETRTLVHCKWDVKWCSCCGKVWQVIKKLTTNLPYDQATPLPGMHPKEGKAVTLTAVCTPMFRAALFTIAKGRSNPSVY